MRVPSVAKISEEDSIDGFSSSSNDGSLPNKPRFKAMINTTNKPKPQRNIFQKVFIEFDIII
jgi:hypothetical protein